MAQAEYILEEVDDPDECRLMELSARELAAAHGATVGSRVALRPGAGFYGVVYTNKAAFVAVWHKRPKPTGAR